MSMLGNIYKDINKQMDQKAEPHKVRWWHILLLIMLIAGTIYTTIDRKNGTAQQQTAQYLTCEGSVFSTFYHITYKSSKDMQADIDSILSSVDNSLSAFNKDSQITKLNNNITTKTDKMIRDVFVLAQEVSENTNGAFDVTVAPLVNAWGFGFKNKENVSDSLIEELKSHVGFRKLCLKGNDLIKEDPNIMLDFSAIAKGYGVDAVGHLLEKNGIKDYMVEIGGEVRLRGVNPKGEPWNIGIVKPDLDPMGTNEELEQVLHITDISMATSGNYRNFYVKGNKRYAHTIDPRTGYPISHSLLSATVLATNCATADAYATAFMVLGMEGAINVLEQHPELKAFLIYSDAKGNYATWHTDNLQIDKTKND